MPNNQTFIGTMLAWICFWCRSLGHAWKRGWAVTGAISLLSWAVTPTINALDAVQKYAVNKQWWDWAKLDFAWWAPLLPLAVLIVIYLGWAPYKYNRDLEKKHSDSTRDAKADFARKEASLTAQIQVLEERAKPKLKYACSMDVPACMVPWGHLRCFRMVVENLSSYQGLDHCRGSLIRIKLGNLVVRDFETEKLPFAPCQAPDSTNKTIAGGEICQLDVLCVDTNRTPQFVCLLLANAELKPLYNKNGKPTFEAIGDYFIDVRVFGNGVPWEEQHLKFKWTGNGDTSEISMA